MTVRIRRGILPFAVASLLATPAVMAQNVTTAAITGEVVNAGGRPVAGATVKIVNVPSGTTRIVATNASGRYNAKGLRVGGPYDITVTKTGLGQSERSQVFLRLGQTSAINLVMRKVQNLAAINVSASTVAQIFSPADKGLSTSVSHRVLEATPTPNRSIADIARLDPLVAIVDRGDGAISMAGLNNRYNTISVDGVGVGDPFGLNANGLAYVGSPISTDTIAAYSIATANYDVSSDTVGASINAVTKSGTNQFHGSIYYAYRNADKFVGDAGWLDPSNPGYDYHGYAKNWTGGATFSGPIIKDKLFFFASYEKEKTTGIGATSANGLDASLGSGPSTSNKVSPGDLQKIINIAKNLGLTPGTMAGGGGVALEDRRELVKLDWNITNNHRASLTYQRTYEIQPIVQGNSSNGIGLSSYWYANNRTGKNVVLHLFDDWSDNFSTEAKFAYQNFLQLRAGPLEQPQVQVDLGTDASGMPNGTGPRVTLGEDQYSDYNAVDVKTYRAFIAGTWFLGDHTLKGGIDFRHDNIYNLFGRTEFGAYTFWGLGNFASADYNEYEIYQPAPGYTIADIAENFTLNQYAFFLQDTWQVTDSLSLRYGVRVDKDYTPDKPIHNPTFQQAYGINNSNTIDGMTVVEPRLSFNYQFNSDRRMQLRGGFGLFQSNPPMVWLGDTYGNTGVVSSVYKSFGDQPNPPAFSADPLHQNLPASATSQLMTVDALSPNFILPTVWKFSLAFDRELPFWGTIFTAQYLYIKPRDAIWYIDPDIGAPDARNLPDGRFQYWKTPGQAPVSSDVRANSDPRFSGESTLLTNTSGGKSQSLTLMLKKPFTANWFGTLGVTFEHATDVNPGTSSQASSNYSKRAWINPNDAELGNSNQLIQRRITAMLTWQHQFFGDYLTSVTAFYSGHTGHPYSWVFGNDANGDGYATDLVFIPEQGQVTFEPGTSATAIQQFYAFIQGHNYLKDHQGQIAGRNKVFAPWVNDLDLSFRQQVPGFFRGSRGEIRLDIYNFLNLLDKNWGQVSYVPFYYTRSLANYAGVGPDGKYIYSLPTDKHGNYQPEQRVIYDGGSIQTNVVSRWSAMVTLRYTF